MGIEDDLRTLIADSAVLDIPIYARYFPCGLPESVMVQRAGGYPIKAGIRRAGHIVTVMSASPDMARAAINLRTARDALITSIPADIGEAHYYTARALGDGMVRRKTARGEVYVDYVEMEVMASL